MNCGAPIYEGSVKRVFQAANNPERLWFEFTDDYSVFDWGKMPDTIANKGRALTLLGAYFFDRLGEADLWKRLPESAHLRQFDPSWLSKRYADPVFKQMQSQGLPHHFAGLAADSGAELTLLEAVAPEHVFMSVQKAAVNRPEPVQVWGQSLYSYDLVTKPEPVQLVPLEVVFRFGMPAGSSLKERLDKDPDYARALGFDQTPAAQTWFARPVLEFFTKLERKDRLLTVQEAFTISQLTPDQFTQLCEISCAAALGLYVLFAEKGIELWDGKFEFIIADGKILLADSIGPDELRLIYKGVHLSKEMLRQFYRGSLWEESLKKAQKLALMRGQQDFKSICADELGQKPEPLPARLKTSVDHLYGTLVNHVTGQSLFAGQPDMESFVASLSAVNEVKQR